MPAPGNPSAGMSVGVAPGASAAPTPATPEPPGMWGSIKGVIGKAAGDFVQSLGDTPEERQQNLAAFTKSIGTINELGKGLGQTTLMQRLGQKKGAEMVNEQQAAAHAPGMTMDPLPPMSPERISQLMQDVGLGVQGIREATRWRG